MSFNSYVGSFAMNTSTGNQTVTGIGFTPKLILFFGNDNASDGSAVDYSYMQGAAASSTSRGCIHMISSDNVGTSVSRARNDVGKCITYINAAGTLLADADFVSHGSGEFTINVTTADAVARIINFIALGGSELTNVFVGNSNEATVTGDQAITGVGFQPDALLFFSGRATATASATGTIIRYTQGITDGTNDKGNGGAVNHNATTSLTNSAISTSAVFQRTGSGSDIYTGVATLSTMGADGYTLNWTTVASNFMYVYVAIKGIQVEVGNTTQPTSTGVVTINTSITPKTLLLFSTNDATSGSVTANNRLSVGAASSVSNQFCLWCGDQDNQDVTIADQNLDRTVIMKFMTEGTPTLVAEAEVTSFRRKSTALNWTTADATARIIDYMAFGRIPKKPQIIMI